jgi:glycine/D-amino acid oxidase-like deaminating enzyme
MHSAPIVVDCAGAWSPEIARTVGVDLPIAGWRHDVAFVRGSSTATGGYPMVVDRINSIYFRPEGGDLTLVALQDGNEVGAPLEQPTTSATPGFIERIAERLPRRFPAMADATIHSSHSGQDGITPDQRPVLGQVGPQGFYVASGFSGVGFKIAPAVGLCMAELITEGRTSSADISTFELDRFRRGEGQGDFESQTLPTWT